MCAVELFRMPAPGGKIGHAEMRIGDSPVMLADEHPEMGASGPKTVGGTPVKLMLYIEDVDSVFKKALDAGAKELRAIENKFYGDRAGSFIDPYGHEWTIATHIEDVSEEEMKIRAEKLFGG